MPGRKRHQRSYRHEGDNKNEGNTVKDPYWSEWKEVGRWKGCTGKQWTDQRGDCKIQIEKKTVVPE